MKHLTFERWEDGRWFVVFPEYDGDQEDQEMVEGADTFLDFITTDGMYVNMTIDTEDHSGWNCLSLVDHDDLGGTYEVQGVEGFNQDVWLCNVVHEMLGEHPETIYFKCED